MKQAKRIVAMVLCLLALLALPAGAVMEKGEPNITAQTTMKEVRNNPGIRNSGFYTYSQDKDCPPGQALWEMTTVEGYTNEYVAEGCAKGLNLVIENYNNGVQVTHSFYTDAEKAADRTKNNTGLFYFPAKAENAKFALILAGSGANESAELEEGACTAWQLHEMAMPPLFCGIASGRMLPMTLRWRTLAGPCSTLRNTLRSLASSRSSTPSWDIPWAAT